MELVAASRVYRPLSDPKRLRFAAFSQTAAYNVWYGMHGTFDMPVPHPVHTENHGDVMYYPTRGKFLAIASVAPGEILILAPTRTASYAFQKLRGTGTQPMGGTASSGDPVEDIDLDRDAIAYSTTPDATYGWLENAPVLFASGGTGSTDHSHPIFLENTAPQPTTELGRTTTRDHMFQLMGGEAHVEITTMYTNTANANYVGLRTLRQAYGQSCPVEPIASAAAELTNPRANWRVPENAFWDYTLSQAMSLGGNVRTIAPASTHHVKFRIMPNGDGWCPAQDTAASAGNGNNVTNGAPARNNALNVFCDGGGFLCIQNSGAESSGNVLVTLRGWVTYNVTAPPRSLARLNGTARAAKNHTVGGLGSVHMGAGHADDEITAKKVLQDANFSEGVHATLAHAGDAIKDLWGGVEGKDNASEVVSIGTGAAEAASDLAEGALTAVATAGTIAEKAGNAVGHVFDFAAHFL